MPEEANWIAAEEEEIAQLIAMGTWELVTLPRGRKAIKSKWVYRIKTDPNATSRDIKHDYAHVAIARRPE
jgi:hypothetical protein